jgi:predicted DCC family thiol-disulfide oxidoreductase YuxK
MSVTTPEHPLALFFDGECCFCNRWVRRLIAADTTHRTRFGPKQGATFAALRATHPEAAQVDSIVLVQRQGEGERVLVRSAAVRVLIDGLPGFGFFSAVLKICPRFLADIGYAIFAKCRGLIFGRNNICDVARPPDMTLFLD